VLPFLTILTAAAVGFLPPAEPNGSPPGVGAAVPDFSLKDIHRRARSLAGFPDKKAFVVAFVDTECPLASLFVPSLIALHKEYAAKGVQFLAINSSGQDSFVSVSSDAQERHVPFPVLKDFDQKVADAFGATRTPEARPAEPARPQGGPGRPAGRPVDHPAPDRGLGLPDRTLDDVARGESADLRPGCRRHPPEALPGMPPAGRDRAVPALDL
jgi:peroxiredoxin